MHRAVKTTTSPHQHTLGLRAYYQNQYNTVFQDCYVAPTEFPPPLISHDRVFPDRVYLDRVFLDRVCIDRVYRLPLNKHCKSLGRARLKGYWGVAPPGASWLSRSGELTLGRCDWLRTIPGILHSSRCGLSYQLPPGVATGQLLLNVNMLKIVTF